MPGLFAFFQEHIGEKKEDLKPNGSNIKPIDFIIVGQGLAGSVLCLKLIENGYSIKVIDAPELSSCSKVAGGVWNPIVFKQLAKSWMIDDLLPEMLKFYKKVETDFKVKLITERHIVKLFSEKQEVDLWVKKSEGELNEYLDKKIYKTQDFEGVKISDFGYSKVLKSGNLDVNLFLKSVKDYLLKEEILISEKFDYGKFQMKDVITYKGINAKNIIFADGYLIRNNSYFKHIPFRPAKGETLTIAAEKIVIGSDIITKNSFLMDLQNGTFKCGATYDWENLNDSSSENGLIELENKLKKITDSNYKIIKHEAGVRPSVSDRRPVLGQHPTYQNIYVFNGMGTKGVVLVPYFAQKMVNFIKFNEPLIDEVNVARFNKFL